MSELSRRGLLGMGGAALAGGAGTIVGSGRAGASVSVPVSAAGTGSGSGPVPGGSLNPLGIPKYLTELPRLPVMPSAESAAWTRTFGSEPLDRYVIASRQFTQQVLPDGFPPTTVWGYGTPGVQASFRAPACTIEAQVDRPVRITWVNQLVDARGRYLPHLFTVDPTLHWANPPGGAAGCDSRTAFTSTPPPYTGPVPLVTHVHGAHVSEESDGYPQSWTLPDATNLPAGYAAVGSYYERHKAAAEDGYGVRWQPGSSTYQYSNDQRATALWYHDHVLGMTRLSVQAGLAGLYLLRGGPHDLPAGVLPAGAQEIGLVLQDRSFDRDGSLFFPRSRAFFGDTAPGGPWIPATDTPPYWNPEYFANTVLVNGATWPVWHAERRRYRLRVLNSCNARTFLLKLVANPLAPRPPGAALPLWQIGADGGFLSRPVQLESVIIAPAERADVILDLSGVPEGTALYLINEGPDEPYHGGVPNTDFVAADCRTTGQVMKIVVRGGAPALDGTIPPDRLRLPVIAPLGAPTERFAVSLNELDSGSFDDAPVVGALGTVGPDGKGRPEMWDDPVTVTPTAGAVGEWDLVNFTVDGHPIHIHQTQFQVVSRTARDGAVRGPQPWETGFKDTVLAFPGETTRIRARFDLPGRYVYHCHIIDHEDNEMMRPLDVRARHQV